MGDEQMTTEPEQRPDETPVGASQGARSRARRGTVLVALVCAALVTLLAIGVVAGTRPGYLRRIPTFSQPVAEWSRSSHAEVSCEQCHVQPGMLARARYGLRMAGEFYLRIPVSSRVPEVMVSPTNAACLVCHSDLRTVSPEGDLRIPHRAHVEILKMRCVECHSNLVHEPGSDGKNVPPMESCLTCHDGDIAKDSCSACHTEKAAPKSHAASDWLVVHADQAESATCPTCHRWAEDWCTDCHTQRPVSHGGDWRATHGRAVESHRSCEACHAGGFCIRCHGEVPQQNYDPTLKLVE